MCYTCAQIVTQLPTILGYGDAFVRVSLCTRFAIVFSLSFSNMHNPQHFHFRLEKFFLYVCVHMYILWLCYVLQFPSRKFSHHSQLLFKIPNISIFNSFSWVFTSFSIPFCNPQQLYYACSACIFRLRQTTLATILFSDGLQSKTPIVH